MNLAQFFLPLSNQRRLRERFSSDRSGLRREWKRVIEFSIGLNGKRPFQKRSKSVGVLCRRSDAIAIREIERLTSHWRPSERRLCIHTFAQETRHKPRESALFARVHHGKAMWRRNEKEERCQKSHGPAFHTALTTHKRVKHLVIWSNSIFNATVIVARM